MNIFVQKDRGESLKSAHKATGNIAGMVQVLQNLNVTPSYDNIIEFS